MKLIKTLILFLILAALSGYVYFYEIKGGEELEEIAKLEEQLFDFEIDSVKAIEIRSIFNQFYFSKSDEGWKIEKPVKTGGDKSTIDGLVNTLQNLKKIREFPVKIDNYKDYGLVARSQLAILVFNDGTRDSVRIGDQTFDGKNYFAAKGDTFVYTVSQSVKTDVSKQLFDWRDKSLTKVKQADVREIKLKNKHGKFHLVKEGSNWNIESPRKLKGETSEVGNILSKLENGKAKSVVSELVDSERKYLLNKPEIEVDLYIGESKAHKNIKFSSLENNVSNVKDDSRPQVFTVDSLFLKDLNKSLFDLRYKKIFTFNNDDVDKVIVHQGDSAVTMRKDTSGTWSFSTGESLKDWKMNSLINNINNLAAEKFVKENVELTSKYGLKNSERKVQLYGKDELIVETLFGEKRDSNRIVYCPQSKIIAEVQEYSFTNSEVKPKEFIEEKTETEEESD
jgi:uncharacterized protein DUF4340